MYGYKEDVMRYYKVPDETVRRLPVYLRGLFRLNEQAQKYVSSKELADLVKINPWQIRKDFSYFGDFGTRGIGYGITRLIREIKKILKLNVVHKAALVGVGNLGSAVLAYPGFKRYGFDISAAFDVDTKKLGKTINDIIVEDVSKISGLKKRKISIGIMTVPQEAAQETAEALVKSGVSAILNFSPCYIAVPKKVKVITIDIALDLARLPYYMRVSQD